MYLLYICNYSISKDFRDTDQRYGPSIVQGLKKGPFKSFSQAWNTFSKFECPLGLKGLLSPFMVHIYILGTLSKEARRGN